MLTSIEVSFVTRDRDAKRAITPATR
jgi:hypothetical protein